MKIRSMTATFGCLDGATLTLDEGMNLLVLPNESGKSTWSAFLTAMFYGIDTAERAAAGRIPAKIKYLPWSGKSMEGLLELETDGRILVLQRTSRGNKPMSIFRAYNKQTGTELPELTGENCGQLLLGVERSVFERSAFLNGCELTVTQEQSLSRRLENLAAGGDGQDSYPTAAERLKQWKNRCRYHQSGLLPQTQAELNQVQQELLGLQQLRQSYLQTDAKWKQCHKQAQRLEQQERQCWQTDRDSAVKEFSDAQTALQALEQQAEKLPPEDTLRQALAELNRPEDSASAPPCPPALQTLAADEILPTAQNALAAHDRLQSKGGMLLPILSGVFAVLAAAGCLLVSVWCALLLLPGAVCILLQQKHKRKNRAAARDILTQYGVADPAELLPAAIRWRDWLTGQEALEQRRLRQRELLAGVDAQEALQVYESLSQSRLALERAKLRMEAAQGEYRPGNRVLKEKEQAAAWKAEADSLRAREQDRGGWDILQSRQQQLTRKLEELTQKEAALILAQEALDAAHNRLAQSYAPQLTALAGELLCRLTGGQYKGLVLQKGLELLVQEGQSGLARPLAALSRGTQDQVWLCLRLSITRLLLPEGAPVVLDDALLTFDRQRTEEALALLAREDRQVLVFSCRELP